ncbi:penicillin-insensitive murein endopeptidase [Aquabacterium sp. A7-Y]|uniref:penicillin-insensitive murein endopeptidase n=1 Tax=Aquabacterium sp. A7-Y TaxID=1349605 RepID=UPI00223D43A3|nr:penicillin-insensitive murein endopeptidase [Aquabacterium sp. A7-Y]MCW7538669.1 penicillin-insensitive murein endopeptidase [Aquabacterium sp. A7-Y]
MRPGPASRRSGPCGIAALCLMLGLALGVPAWAEGSRCFGSVARGRLEGGVQLPARGPNFQAYSPLAGPAGRTYVHARVAEVVTAAYAALQAEDASLRFVYGETGAAGGGPFRPHRTHQNGLSVDFFVPVRDAAGRAVFLPTEVSTRFGYDLEFDAEGRHGELQIDFAALAEHLHRLHLAATQQGMRLALVILDPAYLPHLFATPRGAELRTRLNFMQRPAWVRHDEHYHVDFDLPCQPLPRPAVRR